MSNTILFVFEGEILEGNIFNNIKDTFFSTPESATTIKYSFCAEIFQLWNNVKDDPDLDILEVLKERPDSDIDNLTRKDVSEVHLFFDHDAHSRPEETQEEYNLKINNLLETFNNEFERGKLWISYPMAEAIKHCKTKPENCFKDSTINISEYKNYKNLVNENSDFKNIKEYDENTWFYLTNINIQRVFCLINNSYKEITGYNEINEWFEDNAIITKIIHEKQFDKFIKPKNEVVALSPFPLFLLYHFGESFFNNCKKDERIKTCSFFCYQ